MNGFQDWRKQFRQVAAVQMLIFQPARGAVMSGSVDVISIEMAGSEALIRWRDCSDASSRALHCV
jgi:hypothetical protein